MAFLISPGVQVNEIDLTNVIPALAASTGGYAGHFTWGPVGQLVTVSSEKDLINNFGPPDAGTAKSFLTAASFLKYGNNLKVSRAIHDVTTDGDLDVNAYGTFSVATSIDEDFVAPSPATTPVLIRNLDEWESLAVTPTTQVITARYPGAAGNGIRVIIARPTQGEWDDNATLNENFIAKPGASSFAESYAFNIDGPNATPILDEIHVLVIDDKGFFSGTPGSILERYEGLSLALDAKNENGSTNYYKNVINSSSNYIYITSLSGVGIPDWVNADKTISEVYDLEGYAAATTLGTQEIYCGNATIGSMTDAGNVVRALAFLADKETVDVNLIFTETFFQGTEILASDEYVGSSQQTIDTAITSIVNARKDCVGFISAPLDMATLFSDSTKRDHLIIKAEALTPSSYVIMDSTPVYVYNKYTDTYVWISACGHMAGLCANADRVADAWFSPAGYNRGNLLGVTKLAYNADQTSRDDIYKLGVNPIVSFPGQGILLYGDKTLQRKPSAFDRINVRRLFITLEKAIATAAKFQLFEQNDDFTRSAFRNSIEPFLRDVQGRRGITDFRVICDATNNTGEVIDNNNFVADIYIKPTRSINYITLNFIATRTGVQFKEIVG
tara:strand:- start:1280 stop:3124 length:1845 start_codon:yes stop_codon:yes gene_type:complete